MRILAAVLVACSILLFPLRSIQAELGAPQTVPWIKAGDNVGSVIVLNYHEVLTAGHVGEGDTEAWVLYQGRRWKAARVDIDYVMDVALFRTDEAMSMSWDILAPCYLIVRIGEPVTSRNLLHTNTQGQVVGLTDNSVRGWNLYHTAVVVPGDSGGPILISRGWVVGMTIGYYSKPPISIAVYYKSLREFLGQPCP